MSAKIWQFQYSHRAPFPFPSFHLKECFKEAFFLELGGLELNDLLFSTEETVDARQGKQLLGRIPQFSNTPSSLPGLSPTDEEISSMYTGWFASFKGPSHLETSLAESCDRSPADFNGMHKSNINISHLSEREGKGTSYVNESKYLQNHTINTLVIFITVWLKNCSWIEPWLFNTACYCDHIEQNQGIDIRKSQWHNLRIQCLITLLAKARLVFLGNCGS